MTIAYIVTKTGIVVVDASSDAIQAIARAAADDALPEARAIADAIATTDDATTVYEGTRDVIASVIGAELAGTIKTIGAIAFGYAVGEAVAVYAGIGLAPFIGPFSIPVGLVLGVVAGGVGAVFYEREFDKYQGLGEDISDDFNGAQQWFPSRSDPLTLDLDGDGLETTGISAANPILFDHDGDGTKTGTGWVNSDDGFLVFDRNGNGSIDNGGELFGDSTDLYTGGKAADGFAALAQEDTNADGVVNSMDANWNSLRVWRDLNQDGISQAEELFTLAAAGVASINVAKTEHSMVLGNGNQIADLGTYTRTDGSTGSVGEVAEMADIDLVEDTFYREFTDEVPLAEGVAALPEMGGSGAVRDLREAASLSPILQSLLTQFSQATTRQAQRALLDELLGAWADTSGLVKHIQDRAPEYEITYGGFGKESLNQTPEWSALQAAWEEKLHVLEAFNGKYFFRLPNEEGSGAVTGLVAGQSGEGGIPSFSIYISPTQAELLDQSYHLLKESVYASLSVQTRLKPLLDQVELVIDDDGIRLDFTTLEQHFQDRITLDPVAGIGDLIDFNRANREMLANAGWTGDVKLLEYLKATPLTPDLLALYSDAGVGFVEHGWLNSQVSAGHDIIFADSVDSNFRGGAGDDLLIGQGGNDTITGDVGHDVLSGGAGNDILIGDTGNDTYLFNLGDGWDTIIDHEGYVANNDRLRFGADIAADAIGIGRNGDDLLLTVSENDRVTLKNYFGFSGYEYRIETIAFADGTVWNMDAVMGQLVQDGTVGSDTLSGEYAYSNLINGLEGDDSITGGNQDDVLSGGVGNDVLDGGNGNDTYLFNLGDGADTIIDSETGINNDRLKFGLGIAADSVNLGRIGNDLVVSINADDKITLKNYFDTYGASSPVETIEFADGTLWDVETVMNKLAYNGTSGSDWLEGEYGVSNRINGLGGDDFLIGSYKDDVLSGGTGNDFLNGGNGNDTYLFNLGDGADTIDDADSVINNDKLKFGAGITADSIELGRTGNDLVVHANADDKVTLKNYFGNYGQKYPVETIEFADGMLWNVDTVMSKVVYNGTSGSDWLEGEYGVNNRINGLEGDDTLNGSYKDDVLSGGTGNDFLNGGNGNDTYLFNLGDGADTIDDADSVINSDKLKFGAGIVAESIELGRIGNDLIVNVNADDKVTLKNYFGSYGAEYPIETIEFADGTVWDVDAVMSKVVYNGTAGSDWLEGEYGVNNRINGLDGDDTLNGSYKDDVLSGGTGNDVLNGGNGNDTYLFNLGDGADTINEYDSVINDDRLKFGSGITAEGINLGRIGNDLVVNVNADDKVTLKDYFGNYGTEYPVETIEFTDGTLWNVDAVMSKVVYSGTSGSDWLEGEYGVNNRINGLEGDDTLTGSYKADVLSGGAGNDVLYGQYGNDILQGGDGADTIYDSSGNNLMDGGAGNDTLEGDAGNEFIVGRTGADIIDTGAGADVIAFNQGDGQDTILASEGSDNTLSLGGGIQYVDLLFSKSGDDLVLATGASDQLTFKDWYSSAANRSVANLQVVIEGSADHDAASSDPLRDNKIEQFNFAALVDKFDQARAATPALTQWALSAALTEFHLDGSDVAAIGGDLAYQYTKDGGLSNVSVGRAQALLAGTQFGTERETIAPEAGTYSLL